MSLIPDLGIAAVIALVLFFVLLGFFVLFVEGVDLKIVLGLLFVLFGATLGLLAAGEAGVALIVMGGLAALLLDQMLEHFAGE